MFTKSTKMCLALATVLLPTYIFAQSACENPPQPPAWRKLFSDETLTLFEPMTNAGSPQLTARINWPTKPGALYRIIWDYASFRAHIPHVRESTILHQTEYRKWVYQQLELPGPLQDRHYILESSSLDSQPALQHYRVDWKLSNRFKLSAIRLARPAEFSGCWYIRPGNTGGLDALYYIRLDPGGHVPHWLARAGMRRYVKELMEHLRELLHDPEASSSP